MVLEAMELNLYDLASGTFNKSARTKLRFLSVFRKILIEFAFSRRLIVNLKAKVTAVGAVRLGEYEF